MAGSFFNGEIVSLGELGDFRNGVNFSQSDYGLGYPIVNVKQLYGGRYVEMNHLLQLQKFSVRNFETVKLQRGDILFARSSVKASGAGQVAMIEYCLPDVVFSGFIIRYRLNNSDRAIPEYLNYVLRSPEYRELLTRIGSGTTITNLSQETLARIEVDLPPLPIQRAIAHILGTLDDKIELNRRSNRTLEAMARAIFKSWFVDFDPVRAKMEGRAPAGMDAATAALFPYKLVDSELGEIPEGWEVGSFTSIVDVLGGGTPKTSISEYWGGSIPWFSVVDAPRDSDVFVVATEKSITEEGLNNSATRILPVGTTIITARGTVGKIALVGQPMAMNQSCYGLKGKVDPTGYFTYFATRELVSALQQQAHGSVFDTITRDTLDGMSVSVPDASIVHAYEKLVTPKMRRIKTNLIESRTLAALRDALLPRLLSGEVEADRLKGSEA